MGSHCELIRGKSNWTKFLITYTSYGIYSMMYTRLYISRLQYTPRIMHTVCIFAVFCCCLERVDRSWSPSVLLHLYWGNHMIAPVQVKQHWRIWLIKSHNSPRDDHIITRNKAHQNCMHILWDIIYATQFIVQKKILPLLERSTIEIALQEGTI